MTVSTKKAIGDRRGHLSIRRRALGRLNRQRDVAPIRRGRDQGRALSAARRLKVASVEDVSARRYDVLSGNCFELGGRPQRKPRPPDSQIMMVARV